MRKTRNLLLLLLLCMSAFIFAGRVKAADINMPWGFKDVILYCNPESIEPGESAKCYYTGTVFSGTAAANAGFYAQLYTTDNLVIQEVKINSNISNAKAKYYSAQDSSQGITKEADMPAGLAKFKCKTNVTESSSQGCAIFWSTGSTPSFNPDSMGLFDGLTNSKIGAEQGTKYIALGYIKVGLPDDNQIEKCGNICIKTFGVQTNDNWATADCTAGDDTSSWSGEACPQDYTTTQSQPSSNADDQGYDCFELHLKKYDPGTNTETGAFVSYAILAAAALIAISAVTIAKKHNRLQRI